MVLVSAWDVRIITHFRAMLHRTTTAAFAYLLRTITPSTTTTSSTTPTPTPMMTPAPTPMVMASAKTHTPIPGGVGIDHFPLMQPWTPPQKGDLNGDDEITPADAAIALTIAAGGSASCNPATLAAADVSDDGIVTSLDALMILQAAAGAIEL